MSTDHIDGVPDPAGDLAAALVELADSVYTDAFRLPYPPIVQRTFDAIVLDCLRNGGDPPTSVPDLVHRLTAGEDLRPPITLPAGLIPPAPALIGAHHLPSRTCLELASAGAYGRHERVVEARLAELADICTPDDFAICREILIDNVVIDLSIGQSLAADPSRSHLWARVKGLYLSEVPAAYITRDRGWRLVATCPVCGFPAPQIAPESWLCETGYCPPTDDPLLRPLDEVCILPVAYRVFLALPGQAERVIRRRLAEVGIGTTQIPARLTACTVQRPSGPPSVLRVFDHEQPALLADRLSLRPDVPEPHDITVIPDRVIDRRPDYIARLTDRLAATARHCVVPEADLESAIQGRISPDEEGANA
ncbi:MAG TPA: hypothetical protein VGL93_12355 [Streptosporangiaceae bacterium]|jgi:hypothetical protein